MCGIYGQLALRGSRPDPAAVRLMGGAIVHRGPDDDHLYAVGPVAMGLRRLSIIDLEGGRQPLFNEDRSVAVVCNGEIYNFRELRRRLAEAGHRFRTGSDAEVLVHLYEEHGDDFVDHLEGMFGFALWDARRRRMLLGRDRLGIKPVYYALRNGQLLFASEAKAVLAHPSVSAALDPRALPQFLSLGYVPNPYTLFEGIRLLPPGHLAVVEDGALSERAWWRLRLDVDRERSEADWIERLRATLAEAVEAQMVADVPIAAFLSGGIDSSTIVAYMSRLHDAPVNTYAIGYSGSSGADLYNELDYARRVAEEFATEHHEIIVQPDVVGLLPRLVWHMDAPISDSALITSSLVSEFAARDVKVILSGVGGDELFGGYDRYLMSHYVRLVRCIPGPLRRGLLEPLARRLPVDRHSRVLNLFRYARTLVTLAGRSRTERYHDLMQMFPSEDLGRLLRDPTLSEPDALLRILEASADMSELDAFFVADLSTQMVDDLLLLTDKMSMAHSLECRVPLLDERLVELARTLPARMRVRGDRTRYLIKKALRGVLPDEILDRRKRGFGAPVGAWLKAELEPLVGHLLSGARIRERGLFEPDAIETLVREHRENRADHTDHLFALITLEIWQQLFIDGRGQADLADELTAAARGTAAAPHAAA